MVDNGSGARSPHQDRPALVEGRPVAAVQGVWRSRGYGYVVVMGQDGPSLFHVAGDFCYADPRQERDPDELFAYYRPLGRDTVAFSGELGQTRIVFDRLRSLPRGLHRYRSMVAGSHRGADGGDLRRSLSLVCRARDRLAGANRGGRARPQRDHRRRGVVQDAARHAGGDRRSSRRAARRGGGRGTRPRARRRAHARAPARRQERGRPAHRGKTGSRPIGAASSTPCCRAKDIRPRAAISCGAASEISAMST